MSKYVTDPHTGMEYFVGQKCFHINAPGMRYEIIRIGDLLGNKLQVDIKSLESGLELKNYMAYFLV